MTGLLSHCLAAMAFSAFLGWVFGLPPISYCVFLAGLLAMIVEMDPDELSPNKRSPIAHSVLFGVIWIAVISISVWGLAATGTLSNENSISLTLAIFSAYTTHLLIDSFTREGIYTFPKGLKIKKWVTRLSKGDRAAWEYWHVFRFEKIRGRRICRPNEDPILNAFVSLPSLLIIIAFVAAMPKPV